MDFYKSLKGETTTGTSQGDESNLAKSFGDITINDPSQQDKFNNPGANPRSERPINSSGMYNLNDDDDE
jgi:hypothetical protein